MSKDFRQAECLLRESLELLRWMLGYDKEDISHYNSSALDVVLAKLIEARTRMAVGAVKRK